MCTTNDPIEDPAGITRVGGKLRVGLEPVKVKVAPAGPAFAESRTVTFTFAPAMMVLGAAVALIATARKTVSTDVRVGEPAAVIVAFVLAFTPFVVAVKATCLCPAGTLALGGTLAAALFELNVINLPPGPAAPSNLSVPTELDPPPTGLGLIVKVKRFALRTVRGIVLVLDPRVAVTDVLTVALTPSGMNVIDAAFEPAGMVTDG